MIASEGEKNFDLISRLFIVLPRGPYTSKRPPRRFFDKKI